LFIVVHLLIGRRGAIIGQRREVGLRAEALAHLRRTIYSVDHRGGQASLKEIWLPLPVRIRPRDHDRSKLASDPEQLLWVRLTMLNVDQAVADVFKINKKRDFIRHRDAPRQGSQGVCETQRTT